MDSPKCLANGHEVIKKVFGLEMDNMFQEKLIKIGYFRIKYLNEQSEKLVSYKEYLDYSEEYLEHMRTDYLSGKLHLYCACSEKNDLELSITENHIIRVKNNKLQEAHKHSCPKSIYYQNWINTSKKGVFLIGENNELIFNITMPSVVKNTSSTNSVSGSSNENKVTHTSLLAMATTFNALAWEKQTFSIKKKIGIANKNKETPNWSYKEADEFMRLMYGISNDIYVQNGHSLSLFSSLLYHKDSYYNNTDYKTRYFIFSEILKQGEFKEERKYQYVTIKLQSNISNKTAIRIPTDMYREIFMNHPEEIGCKRYIAGYVYRNLYNDSDWMTFLKGFVFYTSLNGLYAESPEIARCFNYFAEKKILFKRCYQPIESYGDNIPTIIIERLRKKDILVDFVRSKQMRSKRLTYVDNNKEYKVYVLTYDELAPDQIYNLIFNNETS